MPRLAENCTYRNQIIEKFENGEIVKETFNSEIHSNQKGHSVEIEEFSCRSEFYVKSDFMNHHSVESSVSFCHSDFT